ncbi:MAG: MFS transporter [Candidatus Obscuribacterales bacterium]|nr:MFS transporter [Candidatus Obscuribacterales bacterium]
MSSDISDLPCEEPTGKSAGFGPLMKNRQFMSLWIAQIFSQFADRAVFVLFVAILTIQQSHNAVLAESGAAQMTSWLYVAFTIPAVLLSPIAGVYVDRWSHRSVLVLSNLFRAFCVALVVLPQVSKSLVVDFGLAFLISIGCQFFGPAETASIPRLVRKEELYAANSLFFTTMMIALGFGFAIGEPIITHIGLDHAPWVISGFFLIAAALLLGIKDNNLSSEPREPWWEELRFGLNYISSNALVFRAILKITILFSTIITLNIIAVGLAQQVLRIQAFQFGYIVAAAGAGMGIGNFWLAHHGQGVKPNVLVYTGFTGLGLFMSLLGCLGFLQKLIILAGAQSFTWQGGWMSIPLVLSALTGTCCALVAVPTQAALQAAVPEDLRGKVFGAQTTAMSAASTIPVVLAGVLIDNLPGGVSSTLLIIGLPTVVFGGYHLMRTLRPSKPVEIPEG